MCALADWRDGTCQVDGTITDDKVLLDGRTTIPGDTEDDTVQTPFGPRPRDPFDDCDDPASTTCVRPFIAVITETLTLDDIAAFRPDSIVDAMEPNGWTVAGLDTNFYASGAVHVREGELLGQPASVRFTPVAWTWHYGDGTQVTRNSPGASWASLGIREFEPTATSHVFEEPGTYTVDLDVHYAAEYRFAGGSWLGIEGVLSVPANRLVVTVGEARTVLVELDCRASPGGPGC